MAARVTRIRQRMDAACVRAGRALDSVDLLPVSKTFGAETVREAAALGFRRFGENKSQELRQKADVLAELDLDWIMIGHLQTNKAKEVARDAAEVQSLDRLELAQALHRRLALEGRAIDVLVQVKTSAEPSKYGLPPDQLAEFLRTLASGYPLLRVRGLMTLAANSPDTAAVRRCFRLLRELHDEMRDLALGGVKLDRLSMGMSGDFEIAIEEGSTEVRIGTAIFGTRQYPAA